MDKRKITPLVIKAQNGDRNAFQELFSLCYDSLYYFAYKTTRSEDLAADITQESCIEIVKTLDKLKDPNAFSTWAHKITYHQCTRYFRASKEVLLEENEDGETILDILPDECDDALPEQVLEDKEFQNILQNMLNELPAEQRSAMLLYYYEGFSVKQIASIHDTTEGTVKSRLNYGRKAVKEQVELYEKKNGVKLHSIAPLPLLLHFLLGREKGSASIAAASAMPAIASAVTSAVSGVGVATTKGAGISIGVKMLATVATVALAATAAVGAVHIVNNSSEDKESSSSVAVTESQNPSKNPSKNTDGDVGHIHLYSSWEYDNDNHWQVCECGEKSVAEAHNYQGRECTLCGRLTESEGLAFTLNTAATAYICTGMGNCIDTDVVIPAEYNGLPVTAISAQAFSFAESITSVVISDGIKQIENRAFWGCSAVKRIVVPESVIDIDDYAFWKCTSLEEIKLPSGIYEIGRFMFSDCTSLTSIVVPDKVTRIGDGAFYKCSSLKTIFIPAGVKSIGGVAFGKCDALETIHFGGTVEQWGTFENAYHNVFEFASVSWENHNEHIMSGGTEYTVNCADGTYNLG